jgi:hypothetical protein
LTTRIISKRLEQDRIQQAPERRRPDPGRRAAEEMAAGH